MEPSAFVPSCEVLRGPDSTGVTSTLFVPNSTIPSCAVDASLLGPHKIGMKMFHANLRQCSFSIDPLYNGKLLVIFSHTPRAVLMTSGRRSSYRSVRAMGFMGFAGEGLHKQPNSKVGSIRDNRYDAKFLITHAAYHWQVLNCTVRREVLRAQC